jgi:hypothetical protein
MSELNINSVPWVGEIATQCFITRCKIVYRNTRRCESHRAIHKIASVCIFIFSTVMWFGRAWPMVLSVFSFSSKSVLPVPDNVPARHRSIPTNH